MKRIWALGSLAAALVIGIATSAHAQTYWPRITVDDLYDGKITAYECSGLFRDPSGNCLGAGDNVAHVGNVAVYYMGTNDNDPIAPFGTKVQIPTRLNLWTESGTQLNTSTYYVRDTGNATPSTSGRGWVDIYCGDRQVMPGSWVDANINLVKSTYSFTKLYSNWFDVPPLF